MIFYSHFLRYDYSGYGQSTGKVRQLTAKYTPGIELFFFSTTLYQCASFFDMFED